MDLSN